MSTTTKHIIVKGKVQGVFYRKFAKQKAIALDIKGWVKNAENGDVEIFAQGSKDAIEQMAKWCWQGSPKAEVKDVEIKDAQPEAGITDFSVRHYI